MFTRHLAWGICFAWLAMIEARAADKGFTIGVGAAWSSAEGEAHTERPSTPGIVLTLDGVPFDSTDHAVSAFAGYRLNRYFGVELGYRDLGEFEGPKLFVRGEPLPGPTLSAEEWALTARVRFPLVKSFEAQWYAGASRFQFDADGSVDFLFPSPATIEFATPKDRTGFHWGFGFGWQVNPQWNVALGYRKHQNSVINFETVGLELAWSR